MIYTETLQTQTTKITAKECDCCHTSYDEIFEMQEFLHINIMGGYSSIFGDGVNVECDICQRCLKKHLGNFLRVSNIPF